MTLIPLKKSSADAGRARLSRFLPTNREEMRARGWDELDVLIVNGDAYVDHPAFGAALTPRLARSLRKPRYSRSAGSAGPRRSCR